MPMTRCCRSSGAVVIQRPTRRTVPPPQSSVRSLFPWFAGVVSVILAYVLWTHEPVPRGVYDAVVAGDLAAVRARLAAGGDVNWAPPESGLGPLHEAIFDRRTDIAELLIRHGADVNAQGVFGDAPLHDVRDLDTARLLLAHNARTDLWSNTLGAPLHAAVIHGEPALVELLLDHGAAVNAVDVNESTPLHHAAGLGDIDSARYLIAQGAAIDAVNGPGFTALHWAAANGRERMAALLLENGADTARRAMNGESAAEFARRRGHEGVANLIDAADKRRAAARREATGQ